MKLALQIDGVATPWPVETPGVSVVVLAGGNRLELRRSLAAGIARRCDRAPDRVTIVSRAGMRPHVEIDGCSDARWQVSLSSTRGCAIGAISEYRAVGVDVEWIDPLFDWRLVAAEFFPVGVTVFWDRLSPGESRRKFFGHWVRWEAALKCRGTGFGATDRSHATAAAECDFVELELPRGWAGCLALARTD